MNIYEIKQELLAIFEELEYNGGELTPELEEQLSITQEQFKDKVKDYTAVIKSLNADLDEILNEQERLKKLYDRKEKTINKLKEIIVSAVEEFGDTKKSGVKYLDYGIGEVSIRKSESVDVNKELVEEVGCKLGKIVTFVKKCNQLDVYDRINIGEILDSLSSSGFNITEDDLNHINVDLEVTLPLKEITSGLSYDVIREIAKHPNNYKLSTSVSKSELKPELKENGSAVPNLAKLVVNKSLTIK